MNTSDQPTAHVSVLVVGAGPTGLGATWNLAKSGRAGWMLVEATDQFGGLAGSTRDRHGFVWDYGGHVAFSRHGEYNKVMDDLLGPDGWLHHRRNAAVRIFDRWVPFPVQQNLDCLPDDLQAILAPEHRRSESSPRNFGDWAEARFGPGMVEHFFRPYNEKLWARSVDALDWRWNADRVAPPADRASTTRQREGRGWGPNAGFRYPTVGGAGEPWRRLGSRLEQSIAGSVRLGTRMSGVSLDQRVAYFDDGSTIAYEWLVSTIPLDLLVAMSDAPPEIRTESEKLGHTTVHLTGLGFRGRPPSEIADRTWLYFPSEGVPYYRVTRLSGYSDDNTPVPESMWSLLVESSSSTRHQNRSDTPERLLELLAADGVVDASSTPISIWRRTLKYGYPVPSIGRDLVLRRLRDYFEPRRVLSRGRFGAWVYEVSNQDHSFIQGAEAVDRIYHGTAESVIDRLGEVNQ